MAKKQKLRSEIEEQYKWDLTTIYTSEEAFYNDYQIATKLIEKYPLHESKMMKAINALSDTYTKSVQAEVEKKFKEHGRTPGKARQELSSYNSARQTGNIKDMIKAKANLN